MITPENLTVWWAGFALTLSTLTYAWGYSTRALEEERRRLDEDERRARRGRISIL